MNCPSCAAENDPQAVYCQRCGVRLVDDADVAAQVEDDAGMQASPAAAAPPDARSRFQHAMASRQGTDAVEEQDIWDGSYSHLAMVGWWIAAAVVTVAILIAGVVFQLMMVVILPLIVLGWLVVLAYYAYRRYSVHYYLTSQRFIHEKGVLWRQTDRIELIDVDDVTFRQGPIERMFGVGTIHISSSDKTHPEIDLPGIDGVKDIAGMIDDLRRQERRRRGLHIESV